MDQNEAFEFFMEVKNKEIQELKDKLERSNAASNAMINAGMRNRKKLIEAGNSMAGRLFLFADKELQQMVYNWNEAKEGRSK